MGHICPSLRPYTWLQTLNEQGLYQAGKVQNEVKDERAVAQTLAEEEGTASGEELPLKTRADDERDQEARSDMSALVDGFDRHRRWADGVNDNTQAPHADQSHALKAAAKEKQASAADSLSHAAPNAQPAQLEVTLCGICADASIRGHEHSCDEAVFLPCGHGTCNSGSGARPSRHLYDAPNSQFLRWLVLQLCHILVYICAEMSVLQK